MHAITIVSLLCVIVFGTAASVKKGDENILDDIKKCYRAAKTLQSDPGDDKKTKEFLNNCEKFLKDIKLSEVQKSALEKIGYNVDNLFSEKGFSLDPEDENEKDDAEKLNQFAQSTKDSQDSSKAEKVGETDKDIHEKDKISDEDKTKVSSKTEENNQDQPKDAQQKENIVENKDIEPELNLEDDATEKTEEQKTVDQENIEIPSQAQAAEETFNYQTDGAPLDPAPVFPVDPLIQENQQPDAMEYNQNFPQAFQQQQQQQWPQVNPSIPVAPVNPNPAFQQQWVPFHGVSNDVPMWNQQPPQFHQQQAFQNPQFFNQPLDGIQGNIPQNHFQGNNLYGNPQQPPQHVPFNPAPNNFGPPSQANFIPQANIPPEGQELGGGFDYIQPQQNFFAPNQPQLQNDQQQFYNNYQRRVEL